MLSQGTDLRLKNGLWTIARPLPGGVGGFGTLYIVNDDQGGEAVAKLVRKDAGADRELLIGAATQAAGYSNVVPVLDHGEHGDDWVLVMPRADTNLADYLVQNGPISVDEVIEILRDVATALADINNEIVHRDLKPQNVLLLAGKWCLADFGISRYAAATTSPDTRKYNATAQYAAPEQWRMEHATSAADVYAFGVVGYELLTGQLPFPGPDFRQQHLNDEAPALTVGSMRLRDLIEECLYKPPETRPTPTGILRRLERAAEQPSAGGLGKLAEANRDEVRRQATTHANASADQQVREWREGLHATAVRALARVGEEFLEKLQDLAPAAKVELGVKADIHRGIKADAYREVRLGMSIRPAGKLFRANLNGACLALVEPRLSPLPRKAAPFTVISESAIEVTRQYAAHDGWRGRSHSLWFCDAKEKNQFAWYELAFWSGTSTGGPEIEPAALPAVNNEPQFLPVVEMVDLAWPVTEVDRSDLAELLERWLGWFGDAAAGGLERPMILPERSAEGSWRRN